MTSDRAAAGGLDRSTIVSLIAMGLGIFVVANDFTALSVAVVDIEQSFDSTLNRAQWVINAYAVVFGVLIVTGGRLADLLGRRRVFLIGAAIFGTFSLLGGLAPTIELLIAARTVMAVGGAMMWPAVLGMTYAILPDDKAGLAGGLVIGVAGLGNAMGPLIAGVLTDSLGWRWVFFVNVPIAILAIVITRMFVAESEPGQHVGIDYRGIGALSGAVVLILVALDQGPVVGFDDPAVLVMFGIGVILLGAFVAIERTRGPAALVPRRVMRSRPFLGASFSILLMSVIFFGILIYIPQYTQSTLGWSALGAGAGLLPLMLVFAVTSFIAGPLYNRLGARLVIGTGAVCLSAGALWLAVAVGSDYAALVPGLVVVGIGVGLFYSAVTTAAVTSLAAEDNSLAGGIVYMANLVGGSIGLALNTAIVLSGDTLATGIRTAFLVDASLGAVGTVIAITLIRGDGGTYHPLHRLHHRAHG